MWQQMGWERKSAHFGTESPAVCSHHTLPHTTSRLKHPGGFWHFTAADFSDSSAWCGTKLIDTSIAPVPMAAKLDFPPKEKRISGVRAHFQASKVGPHFAKIYKQQLFVSSVSLHPERVAVFRGWFQSADSQPPAVLFYLRRLGLKMLWFCSEKTPLEIAAYLT